MKKITSKKFSKRLLQYGALSVAALGVTDAAGQIIYTDVDPDVTIAVGETFSIDFNADALENMNLSNPDGLTGGNAALAFPSSGGAFVGIEAGGFQYPALLAEGDAIDDASGYTATGARGDLNYYGCAYSNSQWCDTVIDGYLGVRFDDLTNGTTHYGWVRFDTDVNGTNLMIVKDFAFNSTPDEGILAGEGTLGVNDQSFNGFNYYVANNVLNLSANTSLESVQLYNLLGQQIVSQKLSNSNETVNLASFSQGVFIVKVNIEGQTKSFKIIKK